jgi:hypothetical protein
MLHPFCRTTPRSGAEGAIGDAEGNVHRRPGKELM